MSIIGKRFGVYVIEAELGRGGMGAVYKARQTDLDRAVALKVLSTDLTSDVSFIKRFRREAAAVAQLNHPNIVHIYDSGQEDDTYYYVMELVAGESLEDRLIRKGRLEWREAVRILGQACRGLQAAHDAGIIHRDLKPANIMIDGNGRARLMDFGIALDQDAERLTRTGSLIGTPEYMSPEQARAETATPQSDLYSLGVVFYELLTGRVPFQHDNRMITLQQHLRDAPPSPRDFVPDLPVPVERLALTFLAKDPAQRPASCNAVIEELRLLLKAAAGNIEGTAPSMTSGVTVPAAAAKPPWKTQTGVVQRFGTARQVLDRSAFALAEVLGPYRWPLVVAAVLVLGYGAYALRNPCRGVRVAVKTMEADVVTLEIVLDYLRTLYNDTMECYQHGYVDGRKGAPVTVQLANGAILTGLDARMEGDAVVLRVPKVRGVVRLPASVLGENPLQTYDRRVFNGEAESWGRLYYMHWRDEQRIRGPFKLLALKALLKDAPSAIQPPVEQRCRRELRQVAKQWRAVEKARERGEGVAEKQAGYDAAVAVFLKAAPLERPS